MTTKQIANSLMAPDGSYYVTLTDGGGNLDPASGAGSTISITGNNAVTYVDKSGTLTAGGTAQNAAASNTSRQGFIIQNNSSGSLWFSTLTTAVQSQPSIQLMPNAYYEFPSTGVSTGAVSIIGATTGQAWSAREW